MGVSYAPYQVSEAGIRRKGHYRFNLGIPSESFSISEKIRTHDNMVLVKGKTEGVFVDAKTGRLRSIPKDVMFKKELFPNA